MARMQTAEGDLQTKRSDAGQISGRRLLVSSSLLAEPPAGMASALAVDKLESCRSAVVKGFGRRQAYESLRGPNPRAARA